MKKKVKLLCGLMLFLTMGTLFVNVQSSYMSIFAAEEVETGGSSSVSCKHSSKVLVRKDDATCTSEGKKYYECASCGADLPYETIAKKAHSYGDYIQDQWYSSHYKKCKNCDATTNYGSCSDGGVGSLHSADDNQHCSGPCKTCGNDYNYDFHNIKYKEPAGEAKKTSHIRYCSSGCGYEKTENHTYDENHKCTVCEYQHPMTDHWFPNCGEDCALSTYGCSAKLNWTGLNEMNALPYAHDYTMIGHDKPTQEKALKELTLIYTYIPYISEDKELFKPEVTLKKFKHGNYAEHYAEAATIAKENGQVVNEDIFAKGNVNATRKEWTSSTSDDYIFFDAFIYEGGSQTIEFEPKGGNKSFVATMPQNGHYEIFSYKVNYELTELDSQGHAVMFCNGGCGRTAGEATDIYAYISVGYRDTDGNKILASVDDLGNSLPGAPEDSRTSQLVWKNGYLNGGKYTRKVGPEHGNLDIAGYRYVGYKITNTFYVPNTPPSSINDGEGPSSITAEFGDQRKCITYYYEKVTFDVEHILVHSDNSQTLLPTNLNKTGVHLKGTQIENSVNKEIYPGYILMSWDKKIKENGEVYAEKEYDYTYSEPSKEETTRPYTVAEKQTLPPNIIKKSVEIKYNDTKKDEVGYRKDKKITFYYQTVDVMITHIDKNTGVIFKSLDGTRNLSYTKDLTGQYLNEVSLELKNGPANLYMGGQSVQYDARGYVLDSVEVEIEGISKKIYIDKNVLEQYISSMQNKTITDSYKYIIDNFYLTFRLNINDMVLRALIQEQLKDEVGVSITNLSQKMQRNTKITWYYVRANKLVVKHEDTDGNSLTTPETIPIITNPVLPKPTPKDFPEFEIEKYELDGVETPATPTTEVTVEDLGRDRELIFIYKPIEVPESTERVVELRSADRRANINDNHSSEEYLVDAVDGQSEGSIPTSEDLYSNVIVESFHMKNGIQLKENVDPTQKFKIRFIQPYVEENKENNNEEYTGVNEIKSNVASRYISFEIGYNYFTAENAELQIIDHAVVKNASVEQRANAGTNKGSVNILPQYQQEPYMEFEKGGQLKIKSNGNRSFSDKATIGKIASGLYNVSEETGSDGTIVYVADFILPSVEYMYPGIDELVTQYNNTNDESIMAAQITEMKDNIYSTTEIKMDKLTIYSDTTKFNVFTGVYVPLIHAQNRNYLVSNKIINLNPSPDLTSRDVLYTESNVNRNAGNNNVFIQKIAANQLYNTTTDVYYRTKQQLKNGVLLATPENPTIDLVIQNEPGNTVTVHTPVVDNAKLIIPSPTDNSEVKDTWYDVTKNQYTQNVDGTIILGQEFRIQIPHNAQHIGLKGYGNVNYNWRGLYSNSNGINGVTGEPKFPITDLNNEHFAEKRQVKFTFGVIYENTYYPANEWIDLGVSEQIDFNFTAPEWEKELWKTGKHNIYTRVIAENCPTSYYANDTSEVYNNCIQNVANTTRTKYIATKNFVVNVIGEILDLEIRATNDPGWTQLISSIGTSDFPLGQPRQNRNTAYKYGLKLGYAAFFDITTTGWTGDTTESISIKPKYYYVSKTGGSRIAQEVDLYYKTSATGPYISLKDNPLSLDTIMSRDCYKGVNYLSRFARLFLYNSNGRFAMDAGRELSTTYKLLTKYSKPVVNYSNLIKTGTTSKIKLPYSTRLAYQSAIEVLKTKYGMSNLPTKSDGNVWDGTDYCIGHWYGAMWLPSTTVAVLKDNPAPKPDGKGKLPPDGYIIVSFDDIITGDGDDGPYLEYDPEDVEIISRVDLPNGQPAEVPPEGGIPTIIYEMFSERVDYNQGMTH